MLGIIIILLTIIQTLGGSPHLFTVPIKWWKVAIVIAIIVVSSLSGYNEYHSSKAQERSRSVIDSLKGESGALKKEIDSLRNENNIAHKDINEEASKDYLSTIGKLAQYGLNLDSVKNSIVSIRNRENQPTLVVSQYIAIDTSAHERMLAYFLESLNSESYLIDYRYYYYKIYGDDNGGAHAIEIKPSFVEGVTLNSSTIINPKEPLGLSVFLDRSVIIKHCYFVMEFYYKSKAGKIQPPLRKIYKITNNYIRQANKIELDELEDRLPKFKTEFK